MIDRPFSRTTPRDGVPEPGDDPQERRLAGAVGAEQGEHLAPAHLEADVEEDLHLAVGEVDVVDLQGRDGLGIGAAGARCSSCSSRISATIMARSSLMNVELRSDEQAADEGGRHEDDEHRDPRAVGVDQQRREQRAAGGADEEDVDAPPSAEPMPRSR